MDNNKIVLRGTNKEVVGRIVTRLIENMNKVSQNQYTPDTLVETLKIIRELDLPNSINKEDVRSKFLVTDDTIKMWGDYDRIANTIKTPARKVYDSMLISTRFTKDQASGLRRPLSSIIFFGPPGTGKTFSIQAFMKKYKEELKIHANKDVKIYVGSGSTLRGQYFGQSEKMVRELFESAINNVPSIIFIDEVDDFTGGRMKGGEASKNLVTEFLTQLNKVTEINKINPPDAQCIFLGATNFASEIDDAFNRRIDEKILIDIGTLVENMVYLKDILNEPKNIESLTEEEYHELAKYFTENHYTNSDMYIVARKAARNTLYFEHKEKATFKDLMDEAKKSRPTLTLQKLNQYRNSM